MAFGASFREVPKPIQPDQFLALANVQAEKFFRKLKLTDHYGVMSSRKRRKLYFPSPAPAPDSKNEHLIEYIEDTKKLLNENLAKVNDKFVALEYMKRVSKPSRKIQQLISHLLRHEYVVTKADKNLGMCVVKKSSYHHLLTGYLESAAFQEISRQHALALRTRTRTQLRVLFDMLFPEDEEGKRDNLHAYCLHTPKEEDATFIKPYLLLKVHKLKPGELKDGKLPPPRLLAPCMNTVTEGISRVIDAELYPIYKRANEDDLADSAQLIRAIENSRFPSSCSFATEDIKAMYPSIPVASGIEKFKAFLEEHGSGRFQIDHIVNALNLILRRSVFEFDNRWFLQIVGTAMGTPVACLFANIYVFMTERRLVQNAKANGTLLLYKRLVDDIVAVFTCAQANRAFWDDWNQLDDALELSGHISNQEIVMLDLRIYKGPRFYTTGILDISLYQKPYNRYAYIPGNSHHPKASKVAWMNAELTRFVRNNSDFNAYLKDRDNFTQRLLARNYPPQWIINACRKVKYNDRTEFLTPREAKRRGPQPQNPVFVATYTPQWKHANIGTVCNTYWKRFTENSQKNWPLAKPVIAFKSTPNLFARLRKLLPF